MLTLVPNEPAVNVLSTQTGPEPFWQEGRVRDMEAFDQLPRSIRNWLNENNGFYPVEDVLYEHVNVHNGDEELTMVWLLEGEEMHTEIDLLQLEMAA